MGALLICPKSCFCSWSRPTDLGPGLGIIIILNLQKSGNIMAVIGTYSSPDEAAEKGGAGMVWSTRNSTLTLLKSIFKDWQPSQQAWPINYGIHLSGIGAGASGLLSCLALSKQLELWRHKWTVRFFPLPLSIMVPAALSATFHSFLVTDDILLQETACPVCVETRAISLQVALGAIFPAVAAFGGTLVVGQTITTNKWVKWLPRTLPQLVSFAKTTVLRNQPLLLGMSALNLLLAGGLVYAEVTFLHGQYPLSGKSSVVFSLAFTGEEL